MAIDREELKKKALEAASAEEIVALLKDAGEEVTAEEAKKLFEKVQAQTADKELSQDELEAVSGGAMRNWVTDGCASEVTSSSWCVFNDFCWATWVTYDNRPVMTCPKCFNYMYESGSDNTYTYYTCKSCGAKHRKLK